MTGKFDANTLLSEALLTERLNISRTPIRAALQRLQQEGLLRIIPKQGIVIREISLSEAVQLFELRKLVECHIIRNSIGLLNEKDYQLLEQLIEQQMIAAEDKDYSKFLELDQKFHLLSYRHYQNEFMYDIIKKYRERFYVWRYRAVMAEGKMEEVIKDHQNYICLFKEGAVEELCSMIGEQIEFLKMGLR